MRISAPEIAESADSITVSARVDSVLDEKQLWFSLPAHFGHVIAAETADPFLLGLLPVAMALGEEIHVEAPVSATLLFNIRHGIQSLIKAQLPRTHEVNVEAEAPDINLPEGDIVATAVSGGVDSSHLIATHHISPDVPDHLRINMLTFFNVGAHGDRDNERSRALFFTRHARVQALSESLGLPLLLVDSNLGRIHQHVGFKHANTVTVRNMAAALLLQGGVCRYLVGSGPSNADCLVGPGNNMEKLNPFLLPLVRTDRFESILVGSHLTRGMKIEQIAQEPFVKEFLNTCTRGDKNCGQCVKCLSTQFALDVIGELDGYGKLYDLSAYRDRRPRYIERIVHARPDQFASRDMANFARSHGFDLRVPMRRRVFRQAKRIAAPMPDPVRKLAHRALKLSV